MGRQCKLYLANLVKTLEFLIKSDGIELNFPNEAAIVEHTQEAILAASSELSE